MGAQEAGEIHARNRCIERFGIRLSSDAIGLILSQIKSGKAVPLRKVSLSRTVFAVHLKHQGVWLPVVYSKARGSIVTVLPEDALVRYADKFNCGRERRQLS